MRYLFLTIACLSLFLRLSAQENILIDCLHGADFVPNGNTGATMIDFNAIFPNDHIRIIRADSLSGINWIYDQTLQGMGEYNFTIPVTGNEVPDGIASIYAVISPTVMSNSTSFNGYFRNPSGIMTESVFNHGGHVDNPEPGNWELEMFINDEGSYHLKIGFGETLFSGSGHSGLYNLNDYDAVLRILDNNYSAIIGTSPHYSTTDNEVLNEAFTNGLHFMNIYNMTFAQVLKPFVHITSQTDINVDIAYDIPGFSTYARPIPTENNRDIKWENLPLNSRNSEELLYEFTLNHKLNFLDFSAQGDEWSYHNRSGFPLFDIILIQKYTSNRYRICVNHTLPAAGHGSTSDWRFMDTQTALEYLSDLLIEQCLRKGLSQEEAQHFCYSMPWVREILLRANRLPDQLFGFYRFENDVYDPLIPLQSSPRPETINRNMWVMLSNITSNVSQSPYPFSPYRILAGEQEKLTGYTMNEYGLIDEYYTFATTTRDPDFFGVQPYDNTWTSYDFLFYDNPLAQEVEAYSSTIIEPEFMTYMNSVNPSFKPIMRTTYIDNPVLAAQCVNENGRLLVLGSSKFFGDSSQYEYIRSLMHTLLYSPHINVENHDPVVNPITNTSLSIYPNPFNPETRIAFSIPQASEITLSLFNLHGQLIKHLIHGKHDAGSHSVIWDGTNDQKERVASQIVLCRMECNGKTLTRKIALIK